MVANSIKIRMEVEDWRSGRRIGRVAAKSSLSLYKLQILGGKPLGNLLISFNAIFRKIYAGEARFVEKVGRAEQMTPEGGMNLLRRVAGTLVDGVRG